MKREWFEEAQSRSSDRFRAWLHAFSSFFSYYAVPIGVAVLTLLVAVFPADHPNPGRDTALPIRVLADPAGNLDVTRAAAALKAAPARLRYDTHLSEMPIWFSVTPSDGTATLFPSRHMQSLSCFDGATLQPIAFLSEAGVAFSDVRRSGSGVALLHRSSETICRARFLGLAYLSATQMSPENLKRNNDTFYRRSGLLEGGLVTLAIFIFITAIINRDWVYVLFAAWLFGNLRLGAISMGADEQWLGYAIPIQWVSLIRTATVPVYYILTCTLFHTLFKSKFARIGYQGWFTAALALGPVLLVASVVLPVPIFLPVMWAIVCFAVAVVAFMLGRMLLIAPSRTVVWYSAAIGVALLASFSEVISAVFKTPFFAQALDSMTAALVSSLLAALALAEQMRAERAERVRAELALHRGYEANPVGLFTLAPDGQIVRGNPALREMLGSMRGAPFKHWNDYFAPGSWKNLFVLASENGAVDVELSRFAAPGATADAARADASAAGYADATERVTPLGALSTGEAGFVRTRHYLVEAAYAGAQLEGSIQDITERQQAIDTLGFLADHDPLTGALNRRGLNKAMLDINGEENERAGVGARVDVTASAAPRASGSLILAYLDLDRFKLINDLFGHNVGDQVLKHVCSRIKSRLRTRDLVCRIGGDEFVMLFRDIAVAEATSIAQAIVDTIDGEPFLIGRQAFHVRGSIGLIESPAGLSAHDAISVADQACRTAKLNGNGKVVVYAKDATVFDERATELRLIETFSGDLPLSGLFLEMQPILSLKAPYDCLDFEVLLRMRGPDGEIIPPFKIITAAEANGTISALDKWVIETTLTWIETHCDRLPNTSFVSVNLSGASLNDEHFVTQIDELLRRYQHVVPLLCLEITEGVALHDLSNTRRFISSVQRLGAKVALDDFGAGYTSFPYLRDLPVDALKIDGEFVRKIHDVSANAAIVEAIVGLARNLGMQSIAEWAEDASTLKVLQNMGVDYVQGFVIARPQSPEIILSLTSAADLITDQDVLALLGPRPSPAARSDARRPGPALISDVAESG